MNGAVRLHGRGEHRQLQGIQGAAHIPVGHLGDVLQRVVVDDHILIAVAVDRVCDGVEHRALDLLRRQGFKVEQTAAADDGGGHGDHRILRGGADEANHALLNGRQYGIRLGLGPAVAFVQQQIGALPVEAEPLLGLLDHLAHVRHAAGDGVELDKGGAGRLRDDGREGRLAAAGRAPEDGAGEPVGFDGPAQQLPLAQNLGLADELLQRPGAHAVGQGRKAARSGGEEILHGLPPQ